MPTCQEKLWIMGEESYSYETLPKIPAGERPTQATTLEARQTIRKFLMCSSNTILNTGYFGYVFIINTPAQWTVLRNVAQGVLPNNIGVYAGADQVAQYAYEVSKATFVVYKQHKDAVVRMIIYIFGGTVYLETTYNTDTQKRDDITVIDAKMREPFFDGYNN